MFAKINQMMNATRHTKNTTMAISGLKMPKIKESKTPMRNIELYHQLRAQTS